MYASVDPRPYSLKLSISLNSSAVHPLPCLSIRRSLSPFLPSPPQVAKTPAEGVAMAQEVQRSGHAGRVLDRWIMASQAASMKEAADEMVAGVR